MNLSKSLFACLLTGALGLVGCRTAPMVRNDRLGVQTHYGHEGWEPLSTIDSIADLGVGWIRDDIFWKSVEPEKGVYRIPDYVWRWVHAARERNLKIILILNGGNWLYENPYDHDGYVNFARFVAKEMQGQVQALELINEPFGYYRITLAKQSKAPSAWNGWDPKTGKVNDWVGEYLSTINDMADAIDEVAPGAYSIIGLGCGPPLNKRMLEMGVSPHMDGIAMHPYSYYLRPEWIPYGAAPEYVKRDGISVGDEAGNLVAINADLLATSAEHHGPREIWLTEQGYTTFQPANNRSHYQGFTEHAQAVYAQRRLIECLGTGVRMTCWYNFYSKGDRRDNSEDNFGIMRRDGSLKPAYFAIRRVAATMVDWTPAAWGACKVFFASDRPAAWPVTPEAGPASMEEVRVYPFRNADDQTHALAIWSTDHAGGDLQPRTADVHLTTSLAFTTITRMDMMTGRKTPVAFTRQGDSVVLDRLAVPSHPVFLVFK